MLEDTLGSVLVSVPQQSLGELCSPGNQSGPPTCKVYILNH